MAGKYLVANAEKWRKRVESWKTSGLAQSAWCAKHGIHASSFYYWVKKLQAGSKADVVDEATEDIPKFIGVTLTDFDSPTKQHCQEAPLPITATLRVKVGVYCVEVAHNFDTGDVKRLLVAIKEIA